MHSRLHRAVELLKEAADAIHEELYAAGTDEVAEHPILKAHARTHAKIVKFLEREGAIHPGHYPSLP